MTSALRVVVGVIADGAGNVLVNQRRPGTFMAGCWEFPGGKLNPGETSRDALRRELQEELGIQVLNAELLLRLNHSYPEHPVRLHVWRVSRYRGVPQALEGQPLRWVAPRQLSELSLLPADAPIVEALLQTPQGAS